MNQSYEREGKGQITVIGAGVAGLVAAITCAEEGAPVRLIEAHNTVGGRARSDAGPYKANLGPHALYSDGSLWAWLRERDALPSYGSPPLTGGRLRWQGEIRRMPPLGALMPVLRLRGRQAPVDLDLYSWVAQGSDERTAAMLSASAGVVTFHHNPGELSAAFVWPLLVRTLFNLPPVARYPIGGWNALVEALERRARRLGVVIELGSRIQELPEAPVIVATELHQAAELLGDSELRWTSGNTLCLDIALSKRRGDPFVVSDWDEAGWIERFTVPDPSLAPEKEELLQAQMPIRPGESADSAALRLEGLLDASYPGWRERQTWRRRQVMDGKSGALDMPGTSWRDRPAIDRGDGVFLAGDMVAAPGLLCEVSFSSAQEAARLALAWRAQVVPSTEATELRALV